MTTGDILKGRSSMLITTSFPGNSFLAIRMALVTPKTVLIGTATADNNNVIFTCKCANQGEFLFTYSLAINEGHFLLTRSVYTMSMSRYALIKMTVCLLF